MQLILRVQSYCGQVPENTRERTYERFPIIVGRSTSCDYVLDDLSKYISSNHATITQQGDQFSIEDTSSNGVYLNGSSAPLGRGHSHALKHGDVLTIGDYLIRVVLIVNQNQAHDAFSMENPADTNAESAYDPWNGNEPDFDIQGSPISQNAPDLDTDWIDGSDISGSDLAAGQLKSNDPGSRESDSSDDWFDFGQTGEQAAVDIQATNPSSGSTPTRQPPVTASDEEDPFDWLSGGSGASSQDNSDTMASTTLDNQAPISGSGAVQIGHDAAADFDDPFADLADVPPNQAQRHKTQSSQSPRSPAEPAPNPRQPSHQAIPSENRRNQVPPSPAHPHQTPPNIQSSSGGSGLALVLQAAGLNPSDFAHLDEAQMLHQVGTLLGQSIEGIMLLLQSRGEMKNAIRSDVTMLGSRNNNPLKFSFNSTEAISKLLLNNNSPGYLDSEQAMLQAVDDLKIHQIAMLEAMRSAVRAMLAQFDPETLEQKLEKNNPLAANIPLKREAKLWQLFQEKFSDIHAEAVSDFGEMFGDAFRKAYEKRLSELGRKPDF